MQHAIAALERPLPFLQPQRAASFYRCRGISAGPGSASALAGHDLHTRARVARRLAEVAGYRYGGESSVGEPPAPGTYLVPSDTLGPAEAASLGITDAADLFGGVVPHPFVATKLVTHGAVGWLADTPEGWPWELGRLLGDCVLPGYSVFNRADALEAGRRLLVGGPVRLKEASGIGGAGQWVVANRDELDQELERIGAERLAQGFVVERNLAGVTTLSIGQVQAGPWTASYAGRQRTTRNHRGREVYGGSSLTVVQGGFDALLRIPLAPTVRLAIEQARRYHDTMHDVFGAGLFASRCNYDVAQGHDAHGRWCSGVLEQSWRIGGCSGAEVAALGAFKERDVPVVRASTHEIYGDAIVPHDAWRLYDGHDAHAGRLVKYAQVHWHAHNA
ncbi:MAG: DUF3182 family protein [Betaproteobacteria bacterium]|nr:DUF3182 family protein [Betaproteobacteria bacterium]